MLVADLMQSLEEQQRARSRRLTATQSIRPYSVEHIQMMDGATSRAAAAALDFD